MKPALVVSDLHLSATRPGAIAAFLGVARGPAQQASAVYILGDLFDWWLGDDQLADPLARDVAQSIRSISDRGVPVFFARGNRDFLLAEDFAQATGAQLLPEQHVVTLGGVRTLLLHGDELCTDDIDYQRYRARIRTPSAARRLLSMPYFVRRLIAWYLRRRSSEANAMKPDAIMDVNEDAVADAFRRHGVPRMIHGHTHRPARHAHAVDGTLRERAVLAAWHDRGYYLEIDETGMRERQISSSAP